MVTDMKLLPYNPNDDEQELLPANFSQFVKKAEILLKGRNDISINKRVLMKMMLRLFCPGCGKRSSSEDGDLCKECHAFVHEKCQKFSHMEAEGRTIFEPDILIYLCPVCGTEISERRVF